MRQTLENRWKRKEGRESGKYLFRKKKVWQSKMCDLFITTVLRLAHPDTYFNMTNITCGASSLRLFLSFSFDAPFLFHPSFLPMRKYRAFIPQKSTSACCCIYTRRDVSAEERRRIWRVLDRSTFSFSSFPSSLACAREAVEWRPKTVGRYGFRSPTRQSSRASLLLSFSFSLLHSHVRLSPLVDYNVVVKIPLDSGV